MKKSWIEKVNNPLKMLLKKGCDEGVFSGAVVGVYKYSPQEEKKLVICHGQTRNDDKKKIVNGNTFFDLASLTKPLCTVPVILNLVENKKISLDTKLSDVFGTKTSLILKNIKITNLLSHSSGFKAYEPYYKYFIPQLDKENKNKLFHYILSENPIYPTGERFVYSDLGYILLGEIVENISGQKLNELYAEIISTPLGLNNTLMFRPVDEYTSSIISDIAATQYCPWRKKLLQGEVDDEHCWLLNGIAGHAGLFGTIHGVMDMCIHILNQWKEREKTPAYKNSLLKKALKKVHKNSTWCLGFDTPSAVGSSGGRYLSKESVGHLGFTGTSFWIDPQKDIIVTLLTNRIHPTRENEKIKKFRPLLHDLVFQLIETN